jgi:hypothetical protein
VLHSTTRGGRDRVIAASGARSSLFEHHGSLPWLVLAAIMASSLEKLSELAAPPATADTTWMDRAASALRRTLDVVSCLGLVLALVDHVDTGSAAVYLLVMLGVFPHAPIAAHLRSKPDAPWPMIIVGVLMAGYGLGTSLFTPHGLLRVALLGVTLALVGWGSLLYVRSAEGSAVSARRFAVGVEAIAIGSLWLSLAIA